MSLRGIIALVVLSLPSTAHAYDRAIEPAAWTLASKHLTAASRSVRVTVTAGGCSSFDHLEVERRAGAVIVTTFDDDLVLGPYDIAPPRAPPVPQVRTATLDAPLGADVVEDGAVDPPAIRFAGAVACPTDVGAVVDAAPARSRLVRGRPRRALLCRYRQPGQLVRHVRVRRRSTRRLARAFDALPATGPTTLSCPGPTEWVLAIFAAPRKRVLTELDSCTTVTGGGLQRFAFRAPALLRRLSALTR